MAERSTPAAPPVRETHADDELLVYAKRFGELAAENQSKEYTRITQLLNRNKKDTASRLKVALILSLPDSRYRDDSRALTLLTELQRDKSLEDDVNALVVILKNYVEERQKLEENALAQAQKLKDEQHRADELQQKLDELKNIEKTMIERSRGTQP